jgi:hypothetical protein
VNVGSSFCGEPKRIAALILLGILCPLASGCSIAGLAYQRSYRADRFVIYTDHDQSFLSRVGPAVEEIYRGYEDFFGISPRRLGRTSIFLRGDSSDQDVVDLAYSPTLLGYYVPFFNMISVDTKPVWAREKMMLEQILLHEIAHHFILTEYPDAAKECWLNEGLAGNLEMTLFEKGRFEYPLLNPPLLAIARRTVMSCHRAASIKTLVSLGWSEFHDGDDKDLHYALSWALVYYLLERALPADLPLIERIHRLYRLDRGWIAAQEPLFFDFVRSFDLTGKLVEMGRAPGASPLGKLAPRWAIEQLGSLKFLEDARTLCSLESMMDLPDRALAVQAQVSFLTALSRGGDAGTRCSSYERGRDRVVASMADSTLPVAERTALARAAADLAKVDRWWVPILIALLQDGDGDVRAAVAHGLSTAQMKATIVNPVFWQSGPEADRKAEVDEWRAWWARNGSLTTARR